MALHAASNLAKCLFCSSSAYIHWPAVFLVPTHVPLIYPIHSSRPLSVELLVAKELAGISMANIHLTAFANAHLYNALQQLGLSKTQWPDIDRLLQVQKTRSSQTTSLKAARHSSQAGVQIWFHRFSEKKTPSKQTE